MNETRAMPVFRPVSPAGKETKMTMEHEACAMKLIDRLYDGPLDVIGDIHGEIEALERLLALLGYDTEDGSHPEDRRMAFVGDLTDRGPDSPAVLRKVMSFCNTNRAQCVLGNHELALLADDCKHANMWWTDTEKPCEHPQVPVDAGEKTGFQAFLAGLPLALERDDLRVVHACWNNRAIKQLRMLGDETRAVVDLYREKIRIFEKRWASGALKDALDAEEIFLNKNLDNKNWIPRYFGTKARYEREKQMSNPVAIVTSGEETETDEPFFAGGKWRMVERVKWWNNYNDDVKVIVGHYWRNINKVRPAVSSKHEPDLFDGTLPHQWLGARRNVYCVDFSIGGLAEQRAAGMPPEHCSLAAVRVPEWRVVHDNGLEEKLVSDTNLSQAR